MASGRAAPLRQNSRAPGLPPTPGARARLFERGLRGPDGCGELIQPALVAQANHFIDEDLLLFVVEARIKRLRGVGDIALIGGAVDQELRLIAHLLDNVVRRVALGAFDSQIEAIGAVGSEMMPPPGEG